MTELQIEYLTGKTGLETIKVNSYFLHSKYDPIREAKEFAKKNYRIGDVHILFGYGNGYFVDALLNEFKADEKLIVIEPLITIEKRLSKRKYLFIQSNLIDEITEKINRLSHLFQLNNINILCSPNYDKIFPDLYKEFLIKLKEKVLINRVNINTINYMAQEWQRNYIYNIKNAIHDQSISLLYKYTNSPVVVASGGPSLTKQLPFLKNIRDKIILIASGSTVNSLLKENIEPDYVVSIDSTEANFNHFKDLQLEHAKLIYGMFHHYRIRERFSSNAYYFIKKGDNELVSHLTNIVNTSVETLYSGASVAISALDFANYISNGPIALIGQDLAYTDKKTHAENNKNYKMITDEDIKRKGMFYTEGYYGDKVLTDGVFLAMKTSFENYMKVNNNNEKIFNCTEGGIRIKHFKQISFEEFIKEFVKGEVITKPTLKEKNNIKYNVIIELLNTELEIYKKIKSLVNENLQLLIKNKSNTHFSGKTLKRMDKNDKAIENKRQNTCLQVIMGPLNIAILKNFKPKNNETPEESYQRVLNQNKSLYKGYLEAIEITKKYIEDLCEQLKLEGERN